MAKQPAKTLEELSIINKQVSQEKILNAVRKGDLAILDEVLDKLSKAKKSEVDRKAVLEDINRLIKEQHSSLKEIGGKEHKNSLQALEKIEKEQMKITRSAADWSKRVSTLNELFKEIVKSNQEIYKTSHDLQLQGNVTWKQFRELYDGAYQSARQMNNEIGKQLYTAQELVKTQERMVSTGWKGLSSENLTNIAGSMALLQRTLGDLDARLATQLQISYNQFGSQTDLFVTKLGNSLNAFSGSFGLTVSTLQGAVAEMLDVNTFIARNNLEAQITANTSFMQAAALSAGLNMETIAFMGQLGRTAEFGTAGELADIYSAGAYLTGFDAGSFIEGLQSGDYHDQARNLITSIRDTLGGMGDNRLLRNEFMREIQSGFGLSQRDITAILNAGDNIDEVEREIYAKLANSSDSMVDELKDLHMTIVDQATNWWENTNTSQYLGKIMNELGLYDVNRLMRILVGLVGTQTAKDFFGGAAGNLPNGLFGSSAGGTAGQFSAVQKIGAVGAGLAGMELFSRAGGSLQANTDSQFSNVAGGILNIFGQTASGAAAGAVVGGGIPGAIVGGLVGLGKGIIDTVDNAKARRSAMEELDAQERIARRQASATPTGDPLIDAINNVGVVVVNAITGEGEASRKLSVQLDLADKGSTKRSNLA